MPATDPEAGWSVEKRLTKRAEIIANACVDTLATKVTALVEIEGRMFTIEITNGDTLDTTTKEFSL